MDPTTPQNPVANRQRLRQRSTVCLAAMLFVAGLVVAATAKAAENARIWVDVSGTFAVQASLIELNDGKVVLLRSDGKKITIPIDKLSEEDKQYLSELESSAAKVKNVLRMQPPAQADTEPLPVLDLPSSSKRASEGSLLSFRPKQRLDLAKAAKPKLVPDPAPWKIGISDAKIPVAQIDANEVYSRLIPAVINTSEETHEASLLMSVSTRSSFPGERTRNELIRIDATTQKATVARHHTDSIRLLDHHNASGRSLVLTGFNSLGQGGELAIAFGWDKGTVRLRYRRALCTEDGVVRLPRLRWARWIDEEHVVAVIDQTLGLWNVISGEMIYGLDGIDPRVEPSISGGRRYIALVHQEAVHLVSTETGRSLGQIQVGKQIPGVSFSPGGDLLAVTTTRRLQTWDLTSGLLDSEMESRRSLGSDAAIWIDSDLLLSSSGALISIFRGLPLWRYEVAGAKVTSVGNRVAILRRHPASEVSVVALPHGTATEAMKYFDEGPTKMDVKNWQVLGRSNWSVGGWTDRDLRISTAPAQSRR